MDVYFSDQVNDPSLRLFSSTKRFDTDTFDDKNFDEELQAVLAAANINASMSSVLSNLGLGIGLGNRMNCLKRDSVMPPSNPANMLDYDLEEKQDEDDESKPDVSINLSTKLLTTMNSNHSTNDRNNNKSHLPSLNSTNKNSENHAGKQGNMTEPNNNTMNTNRNLLGSNSSYSVKSEASLNSSRNSTNSHPNSNSNINSNVNINNNNDDDYEDNMVRSYERNLKNLNQKFLHEMNEHHNIDQYLLSWRGFHGNMCKGFHTLQRDGQMVDVTIAAGGKIFKAHKLVRTSKVFIIIPILTRLVLSQVLSVCSPYFQKIFIEHPSTHPILFMTDVNSNHMAGLLDFMYSGQVDNSVQHFRKISLWFSSLHVTFI